MNSGLQRLLAAGAFLCILAYTSLGDTRKSSMSFPPQNAQFEAYHETDSAHWSEQFKAIRANTATSPFHDSAYFGTSKQFDNGGQLTVTTDFERQLSSISSISDVISANPSNLDTYQVAGRYKFPLTENWQAFTQGGLDVVDGNASIDSSYQLMAAAGASYVLNPKVKFSVGMLLNRSYISELSAIPIIGFDWDITDRLRLRTFNGAFLTYDIGKSTEIDLGLQYYDQSFKVQNLQGTVVMQMDKPVIMDETSVIGTLGLSHYWKDVFSIRAFAELAGNREIHLPANLEETAVANETLPNEDNRLSFGVEGGIRF